MTGLHLIVSGRRVIVRDGIGPVTARDLWESAPITIDRTVTPSEFIAGLTTATNQARSWVVENHPTRLIELQRPGAS